MSPDKSYAHKAAEAGIERYEAFLRNTQEGIWRVDLDAPIPIDLPPEKQIKLMYKYGYLAEANKAMARMYGFRSAKPMLGLRLGDLLVESDPANHEYLSAFIAAGYKLTGVESHERDRFGKLRYFRNSLIGIVENGYVIRAWGTQQDVTEQHNAIESWRVSESRLKLAVQASKLGLWEWNPKSKKLYWSDELKKIFGLTPADKITFRRFISLIHPEDRKATEETIAKASRHGENYQVEHRVIWPDGSIHWVQGQGKAFQKDGKTYMMAGTSMLIDERKLSEAKHTMLVELNNAKDEFISIASHQLRTPATGVKQYIGMVLDGLAGSLNEEQRDMLAMAYESNERQIRIVNDLLKVANIDAGKVKIIMGECDIAGLTQDVLKEQGSKYQNRKQELQFKSDKDRILIHADSRLLRMVLENFVDNASKYSPEKAVIRVTIKSKLKHVTVTIKDTGIGIDKLDQEKLFQKFTRIQNHLTAGIEGTGLGLYWSKKIIDLHGGEIRLKSRLGEGATFSINLPLDK